MIFILELRGAVHQITYISVGGGDNIRNFFSHLIKHSKSVLIQHLNIWNIQLIGISRKTSYFTPSLYPCAFRCMCALSPTAPQLKPASLMPLAFTRLLRACSIILGYLLPPQSALSCWEASLSEDSWVGEYLQYWITPAGEGKRKVPATCG